MNLRYTFQSIIALHQEELPYKLFHRDLTIPVKGEHIVTVTGVRRCGKSSLLALAINGLLASGADKKDILYIGFDDERLAAMSVADFDEILQAYRDIYPGRSLQGVYMFFDEIQLVKGWELFVLRVYKNYCRHIFITGSTAEMLSGEMASALRGYPDEYSVHTLSFQEYLRFKDIHVNRFTEDGAAVTKKAFKDYCLEGGYPKVVLTPEASEKVKLLQLYFNTLLFRDMIEHYHIKSPVEVVRYFLKRVMENLTKPTSVNKIYNELKSAGLKVSKDYLYEWLDDACRIFLFDRVPRYTGSLVKENSALAKYYMADIGLRNAVLLQQSADQGKALENIVFRTLDSALGEDGRIYYYQDAGECDFVIQQSGRVKELVQVCWALDDDNRERELRGLWEACQFTGCNNGRIVTFEDSGTVEYKGLVFTVESVCNFA